MRGRTISAALLMVTLAACGGRTGAIKAALAGPAPTKDQLAELWIDPGSDPRDLFWGIGGRQHAPAPDSHYALGSRDDSGFSVSYDVTGPDKTEWSVKIGPEAQTEVVLSRILWGLGYHQPPIYYLPSWMVADGGRTRRETEARFRPKLARLDHQREYWKWSDNPFISAPQFRGMLVILLMLNSTDLKDDNNSIYAVKDGWDGAHRWFLVRDLGAALGETGKLYPRRNWLDGFERSGFITEVQGDRVGFDYHGRHQELLTMITPADVQWASRQMSRLTDQQWGDAFRAGNYAEPIAQRFITRIKARIEEGLALRASQPASGARS